MNCSGGSTRKRKLSDAHFDHCRARKTFRSSGKSVGFSVRRVNCRADRRRDAQLLVLGHEVAEVAKHGANYAPVLAVDSPALAKPVADIYGTLIAKVVKDHGFDMIVAACTTFAKDIVARAAGMLGGAMAGDVVGHTWKETRSCSSVPCMPERWWPRFG